MTENFSYDDSSNRMWVGPIDEPTNTVGFIVNEGNGPAMIHIPIPMAAELADLLHQIVAQHEEETTNEPA